MKYSIELEFRCAVCKHDLEGKIVDHYEHVVMDMEPCPRCNSRECHIKGCYLCPIELGGVKNPSLGWLDKD